MSDPTGSPLIADLDRRLDELEQHTGTSLVDELYLVQENGEGQQVLLDGDSGGTHEITDLVVDTAAEAQGDTSYTSPSVTFVGAGVRTVTYYAEVYAGEDGGVPTSGFLILGCSSNFTNTTGTFGDDFTGYAVGSKGAYITLRRHFDDGETITPRVRLGGADPTKHGEVYVYLWVAA